MPVGAHVALVLLLTGGFLTIFRDKHPFKQGFNLNFNVALDYTVSLQRMSKRSQD